MERRRRSGQAKRSRDFSPKKRGKNPDNEINRKGRMEGTFQNLEKYDAKGKMYQYTVEEKEITGYHSKIRQTGTIHTRLRILC